MLNTYNFEQLAGGISAKEDRQKTFDLLVGWILRGGEEPTFKNEAGGRLIGKLARASDCYPLSENCSCVHGRSA